MNENQKAINPLPVEQIVTPFIDSIVCGDNVATMKQLPDECIDLTVTSPPYDNLRTYGGHAWDFEGVAKELFRATKKGGVVVWVVADATIGGSETGTSFRQALRFMEIGFNLHDTMIYYVKNAMPLPTNKYNRSFEYMFVFSKFSPKTVNLLQIPSLRYGESKAYPKFKRDIDGSMKDRHNLSPVKEYRTKNNVWELNAGYMISTTDKEAYGHPAIFPEQLAADHIFSWSNKGDTVLDPFSGSGTTCKMAKKLGRHFIGLEVNPAYVEISNRRLKQEVLCL